jgi:hypothetical protein
MHINELEAFWITLNGATLVLTLFALSMALVTRRRLVGIPSRAARIVAAGGIRREFVRTAIQVALLAIAVPGLHRDGPTPLTPTLALFIAIPVLLFVNTVGDAYDRFRLAQIVAEDLDSERDAAYDRLAAMIERGADKADAAYAEANAVNAKSAAQGERIDAVDERSAAQGERIDAVDERSDAQGDQP